MRRPPSVSDLDDPEPRLDPANVVGIRRDDVRSQAHGLKRDVHVDDVGVTTSGAKEADRARSLVRAAVLRRTGSA